VGDISLVRPGDGRYHELEIKTEKGRLSDAQHDRLVELDATGAGRAVVYGLDDALAVLIAWGAIR
jgi:hypothetical protein